ncbi:hypothetical protein, partial [Chengkuizengella marina]|uniref:hypothetical protein n=1 Tax=Chengkuizengella marina TaxID=2507566 RepID=UPI001B3554DC
MLKSLLRVILVGTFFFIILLPSPGTMDDIFPSKKKRNQRFLLTIKSNVQTVFYNVNTVAFRLRDATKIKDVADSLVHTRSYVLIPA